MDHAHTSEACSTSDNIELPTLSTCLSPQVHQLLLVNTVTEHRDDTVLTSTGCLDVDYIYSKLPVSMESCFTPDDSSDFYRDCVIAMAPMFNSTEHLVLPWTLKDVETKYRHLLTWTENTELLLSTWSRMFEHNDIEDLAVLLQATSLLEHSLGDVYLLTGQSPCPSMLKDLLQTKELKDTLGYKMITLLRILIGPPTSLNVRNVVWHGFPFPGEIHRRCVWFLLLLFPSIGHILVQKNITVIRHRETVIFPDVHPISDWSLCDSDTTWLQYISCTKFVQWPCQVFWECVKHHYMNKQYGICTGLTLYYLEQGLRSVFAAANGCPNRVLTAESSTLYMTLDEILSPHLPDGQPNNIRFCIQEQLLEVLFDLLMYQDGPRVRDRLSHGEADWINFPACLADNLIVVTILMSAKFVPKHMNAKLPVINRLEEDVKKYTVHFHPIAVVKSKVLELLAINIDEDLQLLPDLTERQKGSPYPVKMTSEELIEQMGLLCTYIQQSWTCTLNGDQLRESVQYNGLYHFKETLKRVLEAKIPTLYREAMIKEISTSTDREGETVTLLRHIITECLFFISNIQQHAIVRHKQIADKLLRSRQRKNFTSFLENVPAYILMGVICGFVVTWNLYHLQHSRAGTYVTVGRNRFLKLVLQHTENLRTYSKPDYNKWIEGIKLCQQLVQLLLSHFSVVASNS